MAQTGLVFDAEGHTQLMWTWSTDDPCTFALPVYPGGTVLLIDETVPRDELLALHKRLHTFTLPTMPALRERARFQIPEDVRAHEGERLVYLPGMHTLNSLTELDSKTSLLRALPPLPRRS